jgi:cytochrome c biogenesis protein CcmG, thiol:disulfide interchange protein DsbE
MSEATDVPAKRSNAWRFAPLVIGAGLVLLFANSLFRSADSTYKDVQSPFIGKPLPAFKTVDLISGKPISNTDFAGKPFVLNVWASWCATCRIEHPVFNRYRQSGGTVPVLGLNYKDQREDALRWLKRFDNPYAALPVDPSGAIGMDLGVYGAPETYFVDAQGIVRHKEIGELTDDELKAQLLVLQGSSQ